MTMYTVGTDENEVMSLSVLDCRLDIQVITK